MIVLNNRRKTGNCSVKKISVNLRLFAGQSGEKTEKATPKKRQEARKKGQVLQSREITSAVVLLFIFAALKISGGYMFSQMMSFSKKVMAKYPEIEDLYTFSTLPALFLETIILVFKITGPLFAVAVVTGVVGGYAQVGFLFTTETLALKLNRINPFNGLKRIFSTHGAAELVKSIAKIAVIGYIAYAYLNAEKAKAMVLMDMEVVSIASYIGSVAVNTAMRICVALVLMGILDYGYQWWEYEKNLKMTKQELKEEYKQTEGNPEIKSKIKQKQRQISMRRMLHEVPKADVVITNPTHYAVAIKYDAGVSDAPVVVAKGVDYIALRIKDVAKESKVEIVENKPLARNLYESVGIGEQIPPELYQAVAEILAFVYNLKAKIYGKGARR